MNFYHGTDNITGNNIQTQATPVMHTIGGGELGRGFYVGDNMTLAISWAKGRFTNPAVLEFPVNNHSYAALAFKQMSHKAVLSTWRQLRKLGSTHTHTFGTDVVFGPIATAPYAAQYKFETATAVALLNTPPTTITRIL